MKFYIDPAYLTDVVVKTPRHIRQIEGESEEEFLIRKLKSTSVYMTSTTDHPEFNKLREQLGNDGYIKIQRNCWNGDRVLNPFSLNDEKFMKGEQFPCGAALGVRHKVKEKQLKNGR